MKKLEKILKALANRRRLAILRYLKRKRSATVGDIARETDLSFRSTSKHLGVLATVDIVEKRQVGLSVFYHIARDLNSAARRVITLL